MKKILAIMCAAALLVACGGEKKKELTVEEQVKSYFEQLEKMSESGDVEAALELYAEMETWYDGLSEEDKAKADAAIEEYSGYDAEYGECPDEEYYEDDLGCEGSTVGEMADYYATRMLEALNNADSGTFAAVMEESDAWYEALDERDQQVADNVVAEYEQEMQEAMMKVIDNPNFAALFAE